jgi:DNA mismatch endonuclease, patch repair protein
MTDKVDAATRSKIMARVRSHGTKLEAQFIAYLEAYGISNFEEQPSDIEGHPDFVFREHRVVIFVHSCFWHGCPLHVRMPASNRDYWEKKITRNRERDKIVKKRLQEQLWKVVVVWEHDIKNFTPSMKGKLTRLRNLLTKKSR